MKCRHCGMELEDGTTVCPNCQKNTASPKTWQLILSGVLGFAVAFALCLVIMKDQGVNMGWLDPATWFQKKPAAVQQGEKEPYDYDLEYEHMVGVLQRELELLDRNLSRYPEGFLSTLASRFDGITICIVRSLTGTAEAGSLTSADGIQFLNGYRAYIALAAPHNTEYALYHEMCHLIDTVVITESGAYDRWDELNPQDFTYDFDYIANQTRDGSAYLQESNRYFIDTYSMSFPKEDRARILEYAMKSDRASFFRSEIMQKKLRKLCEGIREAFDLKNSAEVFCWEQYLNEPIGKK